MGTDTPVGLIGLGLMGTAFAARLLEAGQRVAGFDVDRISHGRGRELRIQFDRKVLDIGFDRTQFQAGQRCRSAILCRANSRAQGCNQKPVGFLHNTSAPVSWRRKPALQAFQRYLRNELMALTHHS